MNEIYHSASTDRFVFSRNDYIEFGDESQLGRIDHIFLFQVLDERFIFAIVTPVISDATRDNLLDLAIYRESSLSTIVGLPSIHAVKPYMVPIPKLDGVVLVEWQSHTL